MSPLPIGPVAPVSAVSEWSVPGVTGIAPAEMEVPRPGLEPAQPGEGFGDMVTNEIRRLDEMQSEASSTAAAFATGQGSAEEAVMAVERARLGMQLASQLRTKGVEALQDLFRTQV